MTAFEDKPAPKKVAAKKKTAAPRKTAAKKPSAVKKAVKQQSTNRNQSAAAANPATAEVAPAFSPPASPGPQPMTIVARIDIGFGNQLFIRGEGGGLNWDKGALMEIEGNDEWTWSTDSAAGTIVFKFLINDQIWSLGEDLTVAAGGHSISTPNF